MENRQWFIFYYSFFEALSELPSENKLELYEAIAQYSFNFTEPTNLSWVSKAMRKLIKPQLDANNKRYFNGKQKGSKTEANEKQTESKQEAKEKEKDKEKEKVKDKEKIKEKENNNHPTDEFDEALNEFILMRKKIRKPITDKWIDLIKSKLNEMYPEDKQLQIKCLYKSIENSWQWVFALSEQDIKWYVPPWRKKWAIMIIRELTEQEKKDAVAFMQSASNMTYEEFNQFKKENTWWSDLLLNWCRIRKDYPELNTIRETRFVLPDKQKKWEANKNKILAEMSRKKAQFVYKT